MLGFIYISVNVFKIRCFFTAWGTSPAIVYITEIAKADMRGSLISSAPAYASLGKSRSYRWINSGQK